MLLIVNADDLGASEAVNDAVFELMRAGLVTSATLMANGPAFEHAARRIEQFPDCSFGVHLNLTSFAPLSGSRNLGPILSRGEFCRELLTKRMCRELRDDLEHELVLQVQRAFDVGVAVTHFDSHHFIHLRPVLFPVIKAVQRHFGIRKCRSAFEAISTGRLLHAVHGKLVDYALRNVYATRIPSGWCGFRAFHDALVANALPWFCCLELMVHPGTGSIFFEEEIDLLRSGWQNLLPMTVQLGSYRQLGTA
jgi:predicted glycoside hydrolase/deacetylase ChbG (UPF0249 family)